MRYKGPVIVLVAIIFSSGEISKIKCYINVDNFERND